MRVFLAAALVQAAILTAAGVAAAIGWGTGSVDLGLVGAILWLWLLAWLPQRLEGRERRLRAAT